jgi:uncharacterized protein YgiB involved in biofilm formation
MSIRIRRRSAVIGLSALTLTGGLAACGEQAKDTPMKVYASAQDCQTTGTDWNTCNTAYQQASAEHLKSAPRYKTRQECLAETNGDCTELSDHGGTPVFLPLMAGFMLGQMIGGPRYVSHPIYGGRDGGFYSNGVRVDPRQDDRRSSGGGGSGAAGAFGGRSLPREVNAPMTSEGRMSSSRGVMRGGFGRAFGAHGGGAGE